MEAVYFKNRNEWRNWLEIHFNVKHEIWLIYPKKSSEKPRIHYNDAVEEALCFGWIDSIYKKWDQESTVQRFTPRKKRSKFSQANKERLRWLMARKLIHPQILDEIRIVLQSPYILPKDILETIKQNQVAWNFFHTTSDSYRRIRIAYIDNARKRPDEFGKRLTNFIRHCEKGTMIKGYGGIDKYY